MNNQTYIQVYRLFKTCQPLQALIFRHTKRPARRLALWGARGLKRHGIRGSELLKGDGFHGWREAGADAAAVMVDRGAANIGEAPACRAVRQHHQRGLA